MRKRRHRETELFKGTLLRSRKPGFEPTHPNSQSSRLKHYCKDLAIRKASMGTDANCDIFLSIVPLGSWLREEHWSSTSPLFSFSTLQTPTCSITVCGYVILYCLCYNAACGRLRYDKMGRARLSLWLGFVRSIWAEKQLLHSSVMTLTKLLWNPTAFRINSLSCYLRCVGKLCLATRVRQGNREKYRMPALCQPRTGRKRQDTKWEGERKTATGQRMRWLVLVSVSQAFQSTVHSANSLKKLVMHSYTL